MADNQVITSGPHGHPNPLYTGEWKRGCRCDDCVTAYRATRRAWLSRRIQREPDYVSKRWQKLKTTAKGSEGIRKRRAAQAADPKEKARHTARSRRKFIERRDMLAKIKLDSGCVDCGYKAHACALDFDHVDGTKLMGVSRMGTYSLARIMEEVAKTQVVCFRCHRIREHGRLTRGELAWATKRGTNPTPSQQRVIKCRDRGRAFLAAYKVDAGCTDCGYRGNPVAMDFDHVRGVKCFSPATRPGTSIEKLLAEIAKCEVVCANCHRARTYRRLNPAG